jgi:hypothetical protein
LHVSASPITKALLLRVGGSQVLAKHPKYLNRFYKEESQFTLTWRNHGFPDTRETVSTTEVGLLLPPATMDHSQHSPFLPRSFPCFKLIFTACVLVLQLIQDKVNSTVQGAVITVEHTEAQYSLGSGILLQVDGRLTLPEEVSKAHDQLCWQGSSYPSHSVLQTVWYLAHCLLLVVTSSAEWLPVPG